MQLQEIGQFRTANYIMNLSPSKFLCYRLMTVGNAYLIYQLDWPMKQIHNIIELAGPTCSAKQVGRRGDLNSLANSDNCVCVCTANDSFGLLFCNAKAGQARGIAQTVKHVHVVNNWTPPQKKIMKTTIMSHMCLFCMRTM